MAKLEIEIAELIREYQVKTGKLLTIGAVESATGGRIADMLTNVPGSSDYYKGGVVAYSNEVKINVLGVRKETIENYGAVSEQTAIEMAQGGRKVLDVDLCISDTGIAGPSGGSQGKPVGLFYLGLATEQESLSQKHIFPGNREENKQSAAEVALNMLKQYLLRYTKKQMNPPKPLWDSKTGKQYASRNKCGVAVASEFGLTPENTHPWSRVWYRVLKLAPPGRFIDKSTGKPIDKKTGLPK